MSNELMTISAWGGDIQYIKQDGEHWVAITPFCRHLGVNEDTQRRRITKDPLFARVHIFATLGVKGWSGHPALFLRWDVVHLWLARISALKVRIEIRDTLVRCQLECARVLADHFAGRAAQPTHAQPPLPQRRFQLSEQGRAHFRAMPLGERMKRLEYCGNRKFYTYEAYLHALETGEF
jgi:P22_AR N-terminal domain